MDPNACLEEIRRIANDFVDCGVSQRSARLKGERFAELFEALDEWISNGGFLPHAWSRGIQSNGPDIDLEEKS
jgi:hypothetical protein